MKPFYNCYELLGVSPSATNADLRKAFRKLSKRLHPDTTSLPSDEATRQFQNVCEAYDLLSDPVLRRNYDLSIKKEHNLSNQNKESSLTKIEPTLFAKSIGVRRTLSGGELFSLLLLITSIVLALLLGVFIAFFRGGNLGFTPSWLM